MVGGDPRRTHRVRRFVVSICLLSILAFIAGLPVYVRPQIDEVRHADAILLLGGYGDERYLYGLDLGLQGWAPNLMVSYGPNDQWKRDFCAVPPPRLKVYCFVPDPPTTKGEGRELRRLASQYGWRTVIVVTFRAHVSRARFILQQCFDGDLVMAASSDRVPIWRWPYEYAYQTAGYVRAALQPGC